MILPLTTNINRVSNESKDRPYIFYSIKCYMFPKKKINELKKII
jgi:hypothetical protein